MKHPVQFGPLKFAEHATQVLKESCAKCGIERIILCVTRGGNTQQNAQHRNGEHSHEVMVIEQEEAEQSLARDYS